MTNGDDAGGKVTTREFYNALLDMKQDINVRLDVISSEQAKSSALLIEYQSDIKENRLNIRELEKSDRRWGFASSFIGMLSATIAGLIAGTRS